jgi:hypothetical protein
VAQEERENQRHYTSNDLSALALLEARGEGEAEGEDEEDEDARRAGMTEGM